MILRPTEILFLQRLAAERPQRRAANKTASSLCDHYRLGISTGRHIEYQAQDWQAAEQLLRTHDLPTTRPAGGIHGGFGGVGGRIEMAAYGGISEKSLSQAPHSNTIAVRLLGPSTLDGRECPTPEGSYLALTLETALRVKCSRILIVENLESFRRLERYAWLDLQDQAILMIYRGDNVFNVRDAQNLLMQRPEPIWAFFDFDPQGLMMANAMPAGRLERFITPDLERLAQLCDTARGRELFDAQVEGCRQQLDASTSPVVAPLWGFMKRLSSGAAQERLAF